jgi:hypothetical protein
MRSCPKRRTLAVILQTALGTRSISAYPKWAIFVCQVAISFGELPRIRLPKLFGNSVWVPNRAYESAQKGSKESISVVSCRQRSAVETPSAIFQTVSPRTSVNKGKVKGREPSFGPGPSLVATRIDYYCMKVPLFIPTVSMPSPP